MTTENISEIQIRVLPTPNPNALKFVVNKPVKTEGKATFTRPSEAIGLRLAEDLFHIEGVRQLHFFDNVITVTHSEDTTDVERLTKEVELYIERDMPTHNAGFLLEEEKRKKNRADLPPDIQQIESILDETVRMYLQGDGGDIEVIALKGHELEVRYQGACGTCPSSISGTLDAIQGILRDRFDPELQVVIV